MCERCVRDERRIRDLEAELDDANREIRIHKNHFAGLINMKQFSDDRMQAEIDSLTAQLAEAQKDTERLDWVFQNRLHLFPDKDGVGKHCYEVLDVAGRCLSVGLDARQAIDAAMQERVGGGE